MLLIIGKTNCIYCEAAEQLAISNDIEYQYVKMTDLSQEQIVNLEKSAGAPFRSMPQIFLVDVDLGIHTYVGGFAEFKTRLKAMV